MRKTAKDFVAELAATHQELRLIATEGNGIVSRLETDSRFRVYAAGAIFNYGRLVVFVLFMVTVEGRKARCYTIARKKRTVRPETFRMYSYDPSEVSPEWEHEGNEILMDAEDGVPEHSIKRRLKRVLEAAQAIQNPYKYFTAIGVAGFEVLGGERTYEGNRRASMEGEPKQVRQKPWESEFAYRRRLGAVTPLSGPKPRRNPKQLALRMVN